jgi:hypothetical protein
MNVKSFNLISDFSDEKTPPEKVEISATESTVAYFFSNFCGSFRLRRFGERV